MCKLLYIDDFDVWGLRCTVLRRAGYDVTPCDSASAVFKLQVMAFDAVVMNRDLSSGTAAQLTASIPKGTRVLRLERGSAGDHLVAAIHDLFLEGSGPAPSMIRAKIIGPAPE